jgi:carbamoyl-phosphate synthase large subunit
MDQKKVLVTGIGGNVGQGILRNISASDYDIRMIGTNVTSFSAGNHLCDVFYLVPYAYEENYLTVMQKIVDKESIDLIIPSTDYEAYFLSKHRAEFDCPIAISSVEATGIYLDKYSTFLHHEKHAIPFAKATLPSLYQGAYEECIVKPRKGRGSRELHRNPTSWTDFSDEEYLVQDLIKGKEITCAFYVSKDNRLHGLITFERELEHGTTQRCTVTEDYNGELKAIINKMIAHTDLRGAINLQAIVNEAGEVIPFEINCRISGTNSIRSNFGFKDVEYTLQEYLYEEGLEYVSISKGSAVRILMDVIYREETDFDQLRDNSAAFHLF